MERLIASHRRANESYIDDGIRILELAQHIEKYFLTQPPIGKAPSTGISILELLVEERTVDGKILATF